MENAVMRRDVCTNPYQITKAHKDSKQDKELVSATPTFKRSRKRLSSSRLQTNRGERQRERDR